MLKQPSYFIMFILLFFNSINSIAQLAMPDTVCVGTNRFYHVNDANTPSNYTWKIDGVTQSSTTFGLNFTWNVPGTYLLSVQEHGASGCDGDLRTGQVVVKPFPIANAGPDTIICFGYNYQLNASGGTIYKWSPSNYLSNPNIKDPIIISPPPGKLQYILKVSDPGGCAALKPDTVNILITQPIKIFAGNDTAISLNQLLQLNAIDVNNAGFISYLWSPAFGLNNANIYNPIYSQNNVGDKLLTVTAKNILGCQATDDIIIKVFATPEIYVPSAFTPNGDGLNDIVKPILVGIKNFKYFNLYNRFGQLVFTTSAPGKGWDGILEGTKQPTGNYVWMAEGVDYFGNILKRRGYCILIR